MRSDLHAHTTASDGTVSPEGLVALAVDASLDVLAITDHDSVEGLAAAFRSAADLSLRVIAGVELSAVDAGRDVHVLGYFMDPSDPDLVAHLADLRDARLRRAESIVGALVDAGYDVTLEQVLALSDGGAVGRSHVARALVDSGHAEDISDAFRRFIGRGRPFYVAKDVRAPAEAIDAIRAAGGIAVLAHPAVSRVEELIEPLVELGLAGIEAYHADHTPEDRTRLAAQAGRLGLLATGGTDYHGPHAPNPALGSVALPDDDLERFLAAEPSRTS